MNPEGCIIFHSDCLVAHISMGSKCILYLQYLHMHVYICVGDKVGINERHTFLFVMPIMEHSELCIYVLQLQGRLWRGAMAHPTFSQLQLT